MSLKSINLEKKMEQFFKAPFYSGWKFFLISLGLSILITIAFQYLVVLWGHFGHMPDILSNESFLGFPVRDRGDRGHYGYPDYDFIISLIDEITIFYLMICMFIWALNYFSKKKHEDNSLIENKTSKIWVLLICYLFLVFPYMRNRKNIYNYFNADQVKILESSCMKPEYHSKNGNIILSCSPPENATKEFIKQLTFFKLIYRG
jgi:hypothetical protein